MDMGAWIEILEDDGFNLHMLEEKDITAELADIAVGSTGQAIKFVPKKFRTKELLLKSLACSCGRALEHIPAEEQFEDLCIDACSRNGMLLQFVNTQTHKICEAAIRQNADSWKYVKICTPALYSIYSEYKRDARL